MNISSKITGDTCTLTVSGSINSQTAADFENEINGVLGKSKELIIDLKDVDYVSSAGLRVFLTTSNAIEGEENMKIINIKEEVKEVFDMTGFSSILNIG